MTLEAVFPSSRQRPTSPYSPGVRFGNLLFTAGQVGADAKGNVPEDIRAQTRNCFENLQAVLEAAGTTMAYAIKTTVYLTDMKEFDGMNEVYRAIFSGHLPARSTVGVTALARPEYRVEIEMVAAIP